jgi:hypothetical protein
MDRRSERGRREIDYASLFVVALFAIMLIGIMALSAIGGGLFDSITENRSANMTRRGALSYTASKIQSCDETGALQVEHTDNGDVLTILDPSGQKHYQTRIWLEDGYLMESILSDQGENVSSEPEKIAKAKEFQVSLENNIATITTEDGVRRIYLHAKEVVT